MSEIREWYSGKNLLITGSTGFVGKVLLEKLVRECYDINRIYLIVRGGDNFEKRCETFLKHLVFDRIHRESPELLKKIKMFDGDLRHDNLGLNEAQLQEIYDNVNIVIHNGANVRFDLGIRDAVNSNVLGAYRLLEIAKNIKKLDVFVFVSTAYSQSHVNVTKEEHYDTIIDPLVVIKATKRFDDNILYSLQAKILEDFPNTYSFSKHLTEDLVYRYRQYFPVCVVRPVVITGAIRDPVENYAEGLNGYFGFGVAVLRGVFRVVCVNRKTLQSIVPVDTVANTIITTSWLHGSKRVLEPRYYNTTIPLCDLKTFEDFSSKYHSFRLQYPFNFSVWIPRLTLTHCYYYYYMHLVIFQLAPAIFLDSLIFLFGQRPILMKVQRKIFSMLMILMPYLVTYYFDTDNFLGIKKQLNDVDNEIFDTNHVKAKDYQNIVNNIKGIKKYILLEKEEELPRARKIAKTLYVVDIIVQSLFYYFIVKFLWNWFFTT